MLTLPSVTIEVVTAAERAIELRGLRREFGERVALSGIDLELGVGQTLVVLGPNGSGKTTLLRVLAGLLRPSSGEAAVLAHPGHRVIRVSWVFGPEKPSFVDAVFDHAIAGQQKVVGDARHRAEQARIAWLACEQKKMSFVTLADRADKENARRELWRDQKQNDEHAARRALSKQNPS